METQSGFEIFIKPLPPYYMDVIEEILPMPEYPKREILLTAGDIVFWDYAPKEGVELAPGDLDYDLYARWVAVDQQRAVVAKDRELAKRKFLLSNCVKVLSGPYHMNGNDWVTRVEAAFPDFVMPTHTGKRMLIFLMTQVISTPEEMETVMLHALHREVNMQGILDALHGFQHQMEEAGLIGSGEQSTG